MPWTNGALALYHGCDNESADAIIRHGIDLSLCQTLTDFGRGFYTTTYLHQAKNWANVRCRRLQRGSPPKPVFATALRFDISRDELAERPMLCFVVENSNTDYWDLIEFCRLGNYEVDKHNRKTADRHYYVVFGPVSLWLGSSPLNRGEVQLQ